MAQTKKKKKPVKCEVCGKVIPLLRLKHVPDTKHCVNCVDEHGPKVQKDPDTICAKPSAGDGEID